MKPKKKQRYETVSFCIPPEFNRLLKHLSRLEETTKSALLRDYFLGTVKYDDLTYAQKIHDYNLVDFMLMQMQLHPDIPVKTIHKLSEVLYEKFK